MDPTKRRKVIKAARRRVTGSVRGAVRQVMQYVDQYQADKVDPAQTLVLTGFWRSGTTWLMTLVSELTHTKTVFEPLHVNVFAGARTHPYAPVIDPGVHYKDDFLHYFMPFAENDFNHYTDLESFLYKAMRAELSNRWLQMGRVKHSDALLTRVTCKFVRGQLMIPALNRTFNTPVIHIYRDPRAVIASMLRKDWGDWIYEMSLKAVLLDIPDGRSDFFDSYRDLIETYDRADIATRIAVYWMLTETYVAHCAATCGSPAILSYDKLMAEGTDDLKDTLEALNMDVALSEAAVDRPSETTYGVRRDISQTARAASWQSELSPQAIATIEKLVTDMGMQDRLVQ